MGNEHDGYFLKTALNNESSALIKMSDMVSTVLSQKPRRLLKVKGRLIPSVSKFCLDEWQDIWDCCQGNKLHSIYSTVGIVKRSKKIFPPLRFRPAQQTANWSFSSHSLILIEW